MTGTPSELLPCPNPWCEASDPRLSRGSDRLKRCETVQVVCARCEMAGPTHSTELAAIAAWNTRADDDADDACADWRDAQTPAPEGQPVIALYRAFNRPTGRLMKHVVWWREGGWRIYPFTSNSGFVDRWRPLAAM